MERPIEKLKPKLLVVDDDHMILRLTGSIFSDQYDVHMAGDVDEAKAVITKHGPMPVLSDFRYPVGGLPALLKWIREHENEHVRKIPITGMTGEDKKKLAELAQQHGIPTIGKPFDVVELIDLVAQMYRPKTQ